MTNNENEKKLTRDDIGIYYYFDGYEFANGWIYIGDSIIKNIYNLEIDSKEYGDACDEYLKDTFCNMTEEFALEHLNECILEFSCLRGA